MKTILIALSLVLMLAASGYGSGIIAFGNADDIPVFGDWDGDGTQTMGVYRPSTGRFFFKNSNTVGPQDFAIQCWANLSPFVYRDADMGVDRVGVHDSTRAWFCFCDPLAPPPPDPPPSPPPNPADVPDGRMLYEGPSINLTNEGGIFNFIVPPGTIGLHFAVEPWGDADATCWAWWSTGEKVGPKQALGTGTAADFWFRMPDPTHPIPVGKYALKIDSACENCGYRVRLERF